MPKLPTVAIIGRPNTGKSTIFNRLVGRRRAIVSPIPGTTRDPIISRIEGATADYLLMDTGGMGGGTEDRDFEDDVAAQSLLALSHADVILFVVNGREELTAADHVVADALRKKKKRHVPVFLVIAKCDDPQKIEEALPRFYELGIADRVVAVSAVHGIEMDALEEGIEEELRAMHFERRAVVAEASPNMETDVLPEDAMPRVAVVGRPNVGKSSLINALMSDPQREVHGRIVSPIPGTTRDTTDTIINFHDKEFLFIDTAGLRKHAAKKEEIDVYAAIRTLQAIEDADVTVLVLDATEEIMRQDKRIAGLAVERGTGLILLVNKTDVLSPAEKVAFQMKIQRAFIFCRFAPVLFTSALTRENLPKLFPMIFGIMQNRSRRIETSALNRWFQDTVAKYQPKGIGGVGGSKAKYMTQADVRPPTFVLFMNDPRKLHFSSLRFMENKLRDSFGFEGTPIRWVRKGKEDA